MFSDYDSVDLGLGLDRPTWRLREMMALSWQVRLSLILTVAAGLIIAGLIWLPQLMAPLPSHSELAAISDPSKRIDEIISARGLQNDNRTLMVQVIGGAVLVAGAVATWRQLKVGQRQLVINQEGQITERFTRAVDQLGNESVDVRTGGIYALARIAKDSIDDRAAIAEILTAYVKTHSPWPPPSRKVPESTNYVTSSHKPLSPLRSRAPDVQAAMTVLGHLPADANIKYSSIKGPYRFGLGGVDLRFADLRGLNLRGAWLAESNLTHAELEGTDLRYASLWKTLLISALLVKADIRGADLRQANLQHAWMQGARLAKVITDEKTDLMGANTEGARYDDPP
jgi:pentapeptide repeat protein